MAQPSYLFSEVPFVALAKKGYNTLTMHYVCIIKSKSSNVFYTGYSTNLKKRIVEHNSGKNKHTSNFKGWQLITYLCFWSKLKVLEFEKYLKTSSGISFANKRLRR